MVARTALFTAPPFEVEQQLRGLGANLRTARLRRNLTIDEVAQRIGVGRRAVSDVEHGKPTAAAATYAALLWAYGLVDGLAELADPGRDLEGQALARSAERERARAPGALDNDF